MKLAFVVGVFPAISETWMINQAADLLDRGFDIDIYAFSSQSNKHISERYERYNLAARTNYIGMPENFLIRIFKAAPKIIKLLFVSPRILRRALDLKRYGRNALSLKFLFWSEPFVGKKYDLIHLYDGRIANRFLTIKDIVGVKAKIITSLLGYDVSGYVKQYGPQVYDRLKKESAAFVVMSNNMKERVIAHGFDLEKLNVISFFGAGADQYLFEERHYKSGETIQLVSVGRFVEKKGFDDILRALAILKEKTSKKFLCNIIGGGPLENNLRQMTDELGLNDVVSFRGYMKVEDILEYYKKMHIYLQPSKTAGDGDQE